MKKFLQITTLIIFTNFYNLNAQTYNPYDDDCPFDEDIPLNGLTPVPNLDSDYFEELPIKVYNVKFWGIIPEAPIVSDYEFTEQNCLSAIANFNREFNKFNIYFKYNGRDYLESNKFYTMDYNRDCPSGYTGCCEIGANGNNYMDFDCDGDPQELIGSTNPDKLSGFTNLPGNFDPNSINVYVAYDTNGFAGAFFNNTSLVVRQSRFLDWHTLHEMGHIFGLNHTHSRWIMPPSQIHLCENVTRDTSLLQNPNDPLQPYFNADVAGDEVVDTDAVPYFNRSKPDGLSNAVDEVTCEYLGFGVDCQGSPYDLDVTSDKNMLNYMNNGTNCPAKSLLQQYDNQGFTAYQGARMRQTIIIDSTYFNPLETTIASLYQPYKGEYYIAGFFDPAIHTPLFQPGFNYRFIECDCDPDPCNEPTAYNDTNFTTGNQSLLTIFKYETDYNKITHPNGSALQIDFYYPLPDTYLPAARHCYDNANKKPSSGLVTKFNDGVFNTNVTLTPKDSTSINNPNLINQLQPGLYKIDKTYPDGTQEQNVILKENNN